MIDEWVSVREALPQPTTEVGIKILPLMNEIFPIVLVYHKYHTPCFSVRFYDTDSGVWCEPIGGNEVDPPTHWAFLNPPSV